MATAMCSLYQSAAGSVRMAFSRFGSSICAISAGIGLLQEEWVAEECRPFRIHEDGQFTSQCGRVRNVTFLHETNKFRVYIAVTDAVRDVIHSGAQHTFRIVQHDDVCGGAISVFVRFIDDSPVDLGTHFWTRSAEIIHPHFYDVGFVLNQFVDALAGSFRSRNRDRPRNGSGILDWARNIKARYRPGSRFLAVLSQCKFLVPTQTEHRGNTVAQIKSKLIFPVDMAVRIDQAGNYGLSGGIDSFRSGGDLDMFPDCFDAAIPYHQGRVFDCRFAGTVDDACSHPGLYAARGLPTRRCLSCCGDAERRKK